MATNNGGPILKILSNSVGNPQTFDLSGFLNLQDGTDMDPANVSFSNKVVSHSLLREGGILSLEDFQAKELVFPLSLSATSQSAMVQLIIQINQILTSPGATFSWQDTGMSQPTILDGISGEFDLKYSYRKSSSPAAWCDGDLKLFTMPFGHTTGPRIYAAASGIGPLLMISPFASGGALAIGASTQAGVAGFGGAPMGPSSGVFYPGAPSLAGDATAQLQVSYVVGPVSASMSLVSLLPDQVYNPQPPIGASGASYVYGASVPGGLIYGRGFPGSESLFVGITPFTPIAGASAPSVLWAGGHRLLALARASGTTCQLMSYANALVNNSTVASVTPGAAWNLYDLGTFSLRASETPLFAGLGQPAFGPVAIGAAVPSVAGVASLAAVEVCAIYMLPDNSTWFCGTAAASPFMANTAKLSGGGNYVPGTMTNAVLIDDIVGDQFYIGGGGGAFAPTAASPGSPAMLAQATRITQATRGLVPRPDPKYGLPVLAILGVGNNGSYPQWQMSAQVAVLERARYVLP